MLKSLVRNTSTFILDQFIGVDRIKRWMNIQVDPLITILDREYAHSLSREKKVPIDKQNKPIPWFTYPAIDYLSQFNLENKNVFEWGSGNSSLYFAQRKCNVVSIDNNEEWYNIVIKNLLPNQKIYLKKSEVKEYVNGIYDTPHNFDIIVIDGEVFRFECASIAFEKLNEGGMIILDNSDWFKNSAKLLRNKGLIQIDFHGFGPINDYTSTTSFFLKRDFNFHPLNDIQPLNPGGGLLHVCD